MSEWPPVVAWETKVRRIATDWRKRWNSRKAAPPEVRSLWRKVLKFSSVELNDISRHRDLCVTLIELSAVADETSFSLGIPPSSPSEFDSFYFHAAVLLANDAGATLCEKIHESKARVLPKMHTPQTGLTFRSFSIHLALYMGNEMVPRWVTAPSRAAKHKLKLLLMPWPLAVKREWFRRVLGEIKMPREYGFFEYTPSDVDVEARTVALLDRAIRKFGHIDGVVFPEMALTQAQYLQVSKTVLSRSAFLIAGVASSGRIVGSRRNSVHFDLPFPDGFHALRLRQGKHHRWRLDMPQVDRYDLGSRLGGKHFLWEHIELEDRCLHFVTLRPWLTISVLVCEDLARPDPVGDLVRAVGPNLVVALLLDGPQLTQRWSSRYAAVLADDPGSSVLTLTSKGMVGLSCPGGKKDPVRGYVGLWRDGGSGECKTIKLPDSHTGIVLTINIEERTEFAADSRSDFGATGYPVLDRQDFV